MITKANGTFLVFVVGLALAEGGVAAGRHTANRPQLQSSSTSVTRTGDTEITVRRRFAAPPAKVFAALTEPELLRQWMSANGRELIEVRVSLRTGGSCRFVFRGPKGRTFGMDGTYRDVVPGRRIVHTEAYDGCDWEPLVTTTELREDAGGTALVMSIRHPSKKICDTDFPNVQSGTPDGLSSMASLLTR
jgi:uncharacterized protein YndB with AHSA1/START domain